MKDVWLIAAVLSEVVGLVLVLSSLKFRTEKHPGLMKLNPRYWKPIWLMQDWYSTRGYRLHLAGWLVFTVGIVFHLLFYSA
jgi:hypothetical protein